MSLRAAALAIGVNVGTISRQVRDGKIPNRGSKAAPKVLLSEVKMAGGADLDPARKLKGAKARVEPSGETIGTYISYRARASERNGVLS
jgi:hypothetical protein